MLLIPPFILLHFINLKTKKGKAIKFANFEIIEKISEEQPISRNYTKLVLRSGILILLIFAASGAVFNFIGTTSNFNFVLAIDNSVSMSAKDLTPSRLEAAKQSAVSFTESLPFGTKIGLVTFSGNSLIVNKLTSEKSEIINSISSIEISPVSGTDIGSALVTSSNLLTQEEKSKIIILLTDGRSNIGLPIENAIDIINKNNILIYTIGIGTLEGEIIEDLQFKSSIDETELKNIAVSTGGSFFSADNEESLTQAYTNIGGLTRDIISIELISPLLAISALLLIIKWILEYLHFGTIP